MSIEIEVYLLNNYRKMKMNINGNIMIKQKHYQK